MLNKFTEHLHLAEFDIVSADRTCQDGEIWIKIKKRKERLTDS
jgi:hypothetical protein